MRVAYICLDPGVPVFGRKGCSIHVQEIVRELGRQGASVDLFATRIGGEPSHDLRSIRVHQLPVSRGDNAALREQSILSANARLDAILEAEGPFDLVYERYSLWSYKGMEFARDVRVPGLLEINAPLIDEQLRHRQLINEAAARTATARAFQAASSLVAVSDELARHVAKYAAARERIHVIPNGVNPHRFAGRVQASCPGPLGSFTVGFVGTLKPWHDVSTSIKAFANLRRGDPSVRLLIVGDGPQREHLAQQARDLDVDHAVTFTGSVVPEDVPGLLASMEVAVAPYPDLSDFYFSPLKVFEYMAAGVAVVASRIGQIQRLITDDVNGLLCTPGDPQPLARAIQRLRADPTLRDRIGENGRDEVLSKYTWEHVVRRSLASVGIDSLTATA